MEQKDVVIIGGGPAGLAAAVELHKQGKAPAVDGEAAKEEEATEEAAATADTAAVAATDSAAAAAPVRRLPAGGYSCSSSWEAPFCVWK